MKIHECAAEFARSGRYTDAHEVMWALFKRGYGNVRHEIGFLERHRLNSLCREAQRERRLGNG